MVARAVVKGLSLINNVRNIKKRTVNIGRVHDNKFPGSCIKTIIQVWKISFVIIPYSNWFGSWTPLKWKVKFNKYGIVI